MVEETEWHEGQNVPGEIKVLAEIYRQGGEIDREKLGVPSLPEWLGMKLGMHSTKVNAATAKLVREGVLYAKRVHGSTGRIERMELAGHWDKYEPAIRLSLGMDETDADPVHGIHVVSDEVVEEVEDQLEMDEFEKKNDENIIHLLNQQVEIYAALLVNAEDENRALKEAVMMLLLHTPGRLVDILKGGLDASEE